MQRITTAFDADPLDVNNSSDSLHLKDATLITVASWEAVSEGTIRNNWWQAHFEPHMEDVPAEQEDAELSDLRSVAANKLNIDASISLLDDFISADDSATTGEEVTFESVIGDVTAEPREAEDSDASDDEGDEMVIAPPTFTEAYAGLSTLRDFIMSSKSVPTAIQRSLANLDDFILSSATIKKQATITEYFKPRPTSTEVHSSPAANTIFLSRSSNSTEYPKPRSTCNPTEIDSTPAVTTETLNSSRSSDHSHCAPSPDLKCIACSLVSDQLILRNYSSCAQRCHCMC